MEQRELLNSQQLERSAVVANNRMNRERVLFGVNSYQKEFGIDFLGFLGDQREKNGEARWVDLCCGTGNALIQAAEEIHAKGWASSIHLEGVDLVDMFSPVPVHLREVLKVGVGSVFDWEPVGQYDLVTCVHGFHYLGDKLGFLRKVLGLLKPEGMLVVNLDPQNLKGEDGKPLLEWWKGQCKQKGWKYDARRHLLTVVGGRDWPVVWAYLGSDDEAGPNYSGQPVVDSFYRMG